MNFFPIKVEYSEFAREPNPDGMGSSEFKVIKKSGHLLNIFEPTAFKRDTVMCVIVKENGDLALVEHFAFKVIL